MIVPELNYQGQWSGLLRWRDVKAESITQYTGMPFKTRELTERVRERLHKFNSTAIQRQEAKAHR